MAELTDYGFERDNRTDITTRINTSFRNKFGSNLLLTDDSIAGLLRAIIVERELEWEKLLEDVYYSRTLNGAEGIALDDAASYFGFTRQGPQPGSGIAHIEFVDNGTNLGTDIEVGSLFSASNGLSYEVSSGGPLNSNITGAIIDVNSLSTGNYRFFITNQSTGSTVSDVITLSGKDETAIETFALSLVSFVISNTQGNESSVFQFEGVVYIGYGSSDEFIGLSQPIYFESTDLPSGFTFWSGYDVTATEDGYNVLEAGGITSYNSTFNGYVSATNTVDFDPGSENETDAEFRLRIQTEELRTPAGTRDAIASAISEVDNVVSYRLYDNPTPIDTTEADALSFNVVVRGGTNSDIAQTIYDNKPVSTQTSGDTVIPIETTDGQTENIFFTQAKEVGYDLRITYVANNTTPLDSLEIADVEETVTGLLDSQLIGLGVTNAQLASAVLVALDAGRLLSVKAEIKLSTEPDDSYTEGDITLSYDEYAVISSFTYQRIT